MPRKVDTDLDALYSSAKWQRVRRAYLRLHPRCVAQAHASGCTGVATVVDHILPRSAGGSTWDRDNFQALSKVCHDAKTRRERAELEAAGRAAMGRGHTNGRSDPLRGCAHVVLSPLGPEPAPRKPSRVVTGDYSAPEAG